MMYSIGMSFTLSWITPEIRKQCPQLTKQDIQLVKNMSRTNRIRKNWLVKFLQQRTNNNKKRWRTKKSVENGANAHTTKMTATTTNTAE